MYRTHHKDLSWFACTLSFTRQGNQKKLASPISEQVETVIGRGNKSRLLTVFSGKKPFTQRAKNVLQNADDEAFRTKCEFVGSEHLLLALLREPGSTGVRVLELSGINPVRLERAIMLKIRLEKAASLEEARRIESVCSVEEGGGHMVGTDTVWPSAWYSGGRAKLAEGVIWSEGSWPLAKATVSVLAVMSLLS